MCPTDAESGNSIFSTVLVLFNSINCFKQGYSLFIFSELSFNQNLCLIQVEPIFEKGVDQQSMDEARILLVEIHWRVHFRIDWLLCPLTYLMLHL